MSKKPCRRVKPGTLGDYWKYDRKPEKPQRRWQAIGGYGVYTLVLLFIVALVAQ